MRKLSHSSLDWALRHLRTQGDTDKFPRPFEIDVMERTWSASLRDQLAKLDLTQHRWQGERKLLVPKDAVSFRNATQLDPVDALLFAGLVYEVGPLIESRRSPISEGRVFSYRFAPTTDGGLFGADQWDEFWETSIQRSASASVVLTLDITDFYNQISHHSIENQLQRCGVSSTDMRIVMSLLKASTGSISKGIPVGPHPTHLLAEASLLPVDELLIQRGFEFCRYVDDINIFCESYERAQVALFATAGVLDQYHKLTINRQRTAVMTNTAFQAFARNKAEDQPINSTEASVLRVIKKYALGPYTTIAVSQLTPQDLAQLSQPALEEILTAYLTASDPDYVRLRFFLRRLAQIGVPGAVEFIVKNIARLLPALAEVAHYLNSAKNQYTGEWSALGKELLALLDSPIAGESEYIQLVILGIFAAVVDLDHIDKLTARFNTSSPSAQREIVLAAANAGADSWLRIVRRDFSRYDPWLRRAFAWGARTFPRDERRFWIREIKPISSLLERAILDDSNRGAVA